VVAVSDVAGRFAAGSRLELRTKKGERRVATVVDSRPHGTYLLVRLAEVADREEAEPLRGASLEVSVDEVPSAPPGTFYYHELIGCRCRDRRLGLLGTVVDVREDGGGLLLEIEAEGHRLLIPFVKAYLPVIDPTGQLIETDLPPGLVDACGS
jgi:16S rRNA processing protein RimM